MSEKLPSFNQLYQQHHHEKATVLVRRSDGTIEPGVVQGSDPEYPERQIVTVRGGEKSLDPTERFTDEVQEELASELAGEPLRNQEIITDVPLSERMGQAALNASGFENPYHSDAENTAAAYERLSQSARDELEKLRQLQQGQMDAHNAGDWTGSTTFRQQVFMMQQELSEEAQAYLDAVEQQRRRPR